MAALKIVRQLGPHDPDNAVDAIGYLSMIDEVRAWNQTPVNFTALATYTVSGEGQLLNTAAEEERRWREKHSQAMKPVPPLSAIEEEERRWLEQHYRDKVPGGNFS